MKRPLDRRKLLLSVAAVLWAGLLTYFFQPYIHGNQDAINVIVTVFSILAGFLIAIITLVGDPSSLPKGSWRVAQLGSERTYNQLTRKKWLFILYLVVVTLIFVSVLLKEKHPEVQVWLERTYLFLAIFAFILSFQLPSALMKIQKQRIAEEIDSRKTPDKPTKET